MVLKNKMLFIQLGLLTLSISAWLLGDHFSAPDEMDTGTSIAVIGFLGTAFFFFTTVILSLVMVIAKLKSSKAEETR